MARMQNAFTTVRTEGSLLPADFLQRLLAPGSDIQGLRSEDYHLAGRERIDDAASRSWLRLVGAWSAFRDHLQRLSSDDAATTITREKWLYVLFSELGYGRLEAARGVVAEGKPYPISHVWRHVPVHLVGANIDLDKRTRGAAGAATMSPHGLVQELLNRSDEYLWGVVSNGRVLRVLRDNAAMTRQAFVEFDLEAMLEGQEYHDFVLLWMLLHESRLEAERPEECWLEKWMATSRAQGTRALDSLRVGVETAITALGTGLVSHRNNTTLKAALRDGTLDKHDLYRQVLRVVYRLIFLFAAEDRDLMFVPGTPRGAKERYLRYYSASRLRRLAERRRGDGHSDLWQQLLLTFRLFATGEGEHELGVPCYGGLFSDADPLLASSEISNVHLLEAVRALATVTDGKGRRRVDYRNMGAEELGSVYESLLEQHPSLNLETGSFELGTAAGSERKTTGSYYTPSALISLLLDSALEPVLVERLEAARKDKRDFEESILDLKVCDPACGSGHFLIAAAHRLARELAKVRRGDEEPSPEAQRNALRDVVSHCIYGVDLNPMAVELAKVGLWLEAIEPGKPLTFLDHHIKRGNSLLGATPALLERGIPDAAFNPIEGDDKKIAASYKARNRIAQEGQMDLLAAEEPADYGSQLREQLARIDAMPDETPDQLVKKERSFGEYSASAEYKAAKLVADAYCAAFVWPKYPGSPEPVTQGVLAGFKNGSLTPKTETIEQVQELALQFEWFHWHLEFPDVFGPGGSSPLGQAGSRGGFDCVLGNPPWERTSFEDDQFFTSRAPEIIEATTTAKRKRLIGALPQANPDLHRAYVAARRFSEAQNHFFSDSGRYVYANKGRMNYYPLFTECALGLVGSSGRVGLIVQTGLATDIPLQEFWRYLVDEGRIVSLYDFENRDGLFQSVHRSTKFCLLTMLGSKSDSRNAEFGFYLHRPSQVADSQRVYSLDLASLGDINPLTEQVPLCRTQRDFSILQRMQSAHMPLGVSTGGREPIARSWAAFTSSGRSSDYRDLAELTSDGVASLDGPTRVVRSSSGDEYVPLFEGKMIHQYDPCFATYEDVAASDLRKGKPRPSGERDRLQRGLPLPRFWASKQVVEPFLEQKRVSSAWVLAVRENARATDERTVIACVLPRVGLIQPLNGVTVPDAQNGLWLLAVLNSIAFDYLARLKVPGIHLNVTIFSQLPCPELGGVCELETDALASAAELCGSFTPLEPFVRESGQEWRPGPWDEKRRWELTCKIDAALFRRFGYTQLEVDYVLSTFPVMEAKEIRAFGEYRTKRRILELFDEYTSLESSP